MRYEGEITLKDEKGEAFRAIKGEETNIKGSRALLKIIHQGENTKIRFSAGDATSLRAALDSAYKMLAVYEKISGLVADELK